MSVRTHFVVTGHIDHGKSTFIGRLLLEMGVLAQDRLANLKMAATNERLEYSHLTDALRDEKTKGITIGVSQTVFNYKNKNFVFIDAPGHYEFLQNMITGAARADVAFLLIDALEGVKESTLRHLQMLAFLDVPEIVVIINKMDLVDYSEVVFKKLSVEIKNCFTQLSLQQSLTISSIIPVSAYCAENLTTRSTKMPWYVGPVVTEELLQKALQKENSPTLSASKKHFRFIVQDIYENAVVGELLGGQLESSKEYFIHQDNNDPRKNIIRISAGDSEKVVAEKTFSNYKGEKIQSFTILNTEVDTQADNGTSTKALIKRGDILLQRSLQRSSEINDENQYNNLLLNSEHFAALIIWFSAEKINVGSKLNLRLAKQEVAVQITSVSSLIDSASLKQISLASDIHKGFVVKCEILAEKKISFAHFKNEPGLGRFVLLKNGVISGAGKVL